MSKQNIKDYRQQFIDQGYAIVENVLTPKEAKKGPPFCSTRFTQNRQSLTPISGEHGDNSKCLSMVFLESLDLPHPKLLEVISNMIDNPFRLSAEPIPVVTFS